MSRQYSVKFNPVWRKWRDCNEAVLEISLMEDVNEMVNGAKLKDTLDKLKDRVGPTSIALVDTLHRYDFLDMTWERSYQHAKALGDQWRALNTDAIGDTQVHRWDDIMALSRFQAYQESIERMDSEDEDFKEVIGADVDRFFRNKTRAELAEKNSRGFLKEELAGFLAFGHDRNAAYFYHGSFLRSMVYVFGKAGLDAAKCSVRCKRLKESDPIPEQDNQPHHRLDERERGS